MKLSDQLKENLFQSEPELVPNRNGFGEGLVAAGEANEQVVALTADLAESTRVQQFANKFPLRFVECGVAEQNMASVASGLAAMGKIPFIASYAMFSPGRSWEQVRTTIAYNDSNVKIVGAHAGVSVGPDGATHQAIEDLALMRVIPNMVVVAPADANEAKAVTLLAAKHQGPFYFRLARNSTPVIFKDDVNFSLGEASLLLEKSTDQEQSVGIIVTGTLAYEALLAAKQLNDSGIGASVLHVPTIKPLDTKAVEDLAASHDWLLTLEEHQRLGGLGSAVAEHLSLVKPTKIVRLGVDNQFGQSGEPAELLDHYGLNAKAVVAAVNQNLQS